MVQSAYPRARADVGRVFRVDPSVSPYNKDKGQAPHLWGAGVESEQGVVEPVLTRVRKQKRMCHAPKPTIPGAKIGIKRT